MEEKILKIIAGAHPYPYKEVEFIFDNCKSFDWTIKALREATARATDPRMILAEYGYKLII